MPAVLIRSALYFQAYEITREALDNPADWPRWLTKLEGEGKVPTRHEIWIKEHPDSTLKDRAFLYLMDNLVDWEIAPFGTWIVQRPRGFQIVERGVFRRAYEVVQGL